MCINDDFLGGNSHRRGELSFIFLVRRGAFVFGDVGLWVWGKKRSKEVHKWLLVKSWLKRKFSIYVHERTFYVRNFLRTIFGYNHVQCQTKCILRNLKYRKITKWRTKIQYGTEKRILNSKINFLFLHC